MCITFKRVKLFEYSFLNYFISMNRMKIMTQALAELCALKSALNLNIFFT